MPTSTFQQFMKLGSQAIFTPDPEGSTSFPPRDLGAITETVNPSTNTEQAELKDTRGGVRTTVAKGTIDQQLTMAVTFGNLNPRNMSLVFASEEPAEYTQAATPLVDVAHTGFVDELLALVDANGNRIYNVASIEDVKVGVTAVAADNYEVNTAMLRAGYIKLLPGGAEGWSAGDSQAVTVSLTPNAITGARSIKPLSVSSKRGYMEVIWQSENYEDVWTYRFYATLVPQDSTFQVGEYSLGAVEVTAIEDPNNPDFPYGRVIKTVGPLPTTGA